MDSPNPFPLFRLPFLAIEEVFKAMNPFEIINFSMISKRTKSETQQMTFYSKYSIRINASEMLEIWVAGPKYMTQCFYKFTTNQEINGEVVENTWNSRNELLVWKYSNNPVEEWKKLVKYVLEIFKKETIDLLLMTMDAFVNQNVSTIDFLKTNVKSVNECYLFQSVKENDINEHAAYLLKNIKITNAFSSYLHIKNDNFNGKIPKNLKELKIHYSQWIGYERLLEIDCKSVILEKNLITNKEWNMFFKKWIAMKTHLKLEYLEIDYRDIEKFRALVLHGIPHEVVDRRVKRTFKTRRNETQEISGGIDIKRIDGKTATLFVYRVFSTDRFAMSIH
ncbi:hypothetical protein CRE_05311 [Caenorhabditis remanei]|uniref:F-box domain-containing protein n=1 Tax=Caenorhabditis remanei TaxID=31234 RepID=E3NQK3_CAERE|nr:hypothetical protein CRE_05311 [Caenorhabditis remanei]